MNQKNNSTKDDNIINTINNEKSITDEHKKQIKCVI